MLFPSEEMNIQASFCQIQELVISPWCYRIGITLKLRIRQSLQVMLRFLKASCKTSQMTDSNTSNCCFRITASGVNRNLNQFSKLRVDGLISFHGLQRADLTALC